MVGDAVFCEPISGEHPDNAHIVNVEFSTSKRAPPRTLILAPGPLKEPGAESASIRRIARSIRASASGFGSISNLIRFDSERAGMGLGPIPVPVPGPLALPDMVDCDICCGPVQKSAGIFEAFCKVGAMQL